MQRKHINQMSQYLFLVSSARRNGNTERLARRAARKLPPEHQEWLYLNEFSIPAFRDIRHEEGAAYAEPTGSEKTLVDATLRATDLVFVTPLYWYTVPASAKLYLDYWSAWMRVPSLGFKASMAEKQMWVVTVSSGDVEDARPMLETLEKCAGYLGLRWGGVLMGGGSRPGDVEKDSVAMEAATHFFDSPRNINL